MSPAPVSVRSDGGADDAPAVRSKQRTQSMSQQSDDSQTAADFIRDQMKLEAEAREALPYSIDHCTKPLGPLRQAVYACLTCNPPPENPSDPYPNAAGVCYACSVQCHGEHTLVELFNKRNFTCDCGTTRFPSSAPCNLRINPETGTKGGVHSEEPDANNKYNINFRNLFCGCQVYYDPFKQKGTMFQCLGLGTHETGGCGEDWYHPGCLAGLGPEWYKDLPKDETKTKVKTDDQNGLPTIVEDAGAEQQNGDVVAEAEQGDEAAPEEGEEEDDPPMPPGFPDEDEFEGFICYKCLDAYPWLKRYAGAPGFLAPVYYKPPSEASTNSPEVADIKREELPAAPLSNGNSSSKKRKSSDDPSADDASDSQVMKRPRSEASPLPTPTDSQPTQDPSKATCKLSSLPPAPPGRFSLFFKSDFRAHLCHCPQCFPLLTPHPHLLEEEETYEPPLSSDGGDPTNPQGGTSSGGSLYDRGESALRTIDRVRAIEGVMAYQHLKDKLMPFFEEFARSGKVVSAEDVKAYFAKLRGDEEKERMARVGAERSRDGQGEGDNQREQSGY